MNKEDRPHEYSGPEADHNEDGSVDLSFRWEQYNLSAEEAIILGQKLQIAGERALENK